MIPDDVIPPAPEFPLDPDEPPVDDEVILYPDDDQSDETVEIPPVHAEPEIDVDELIRHALEPDEDDLADFLERMSYEEGCNARFV